MPSTPKTKTRWQEKKRIFSEKRTDFSKFRAIEGSAERATEVKGGLFRGGGRGQFASGKKHGA